MTTLYGYYRSSATYRVRIGLNLKSISYEHMGVHLLRDGGEQHKQHYREMNPIGLVPTFKDNAHALTQSIAILEYLEERYPEPSILPEDIYGRAYVRGLAQLMASDIAPLNNLRVLQYLKAKHEFSDHEKDAWIQHWLGIGFQALDKMISENKFSGEFCFGNQVTIADICLIPQIYNGNRFGHPMSDYPTLMRINERCLQLQAFKDAVPENQPDAP